MLNMELNNFNHCISEQHKIKYREKEELLKEALTNDNTSLKQWIEFSKGDGGLVNGNYILIQFLNSNPTHLSYKISH